MSPEERERTVTRIMAVIENDYHTDLTEMIGMAVKLTETIPDQVNNEVRNALNHLARASSAATETEAAADVKRAAAHLERAKRDCLKLSIIEMRDRLHVSCMFLERRYGLIIARDLRTTLHNLAQVRGDIYRDESRGDPETCVRLESLLTQYLDTSADVATRYTLPTKSPSWLKRATWYVRDNTIQLVSAVVITLIATSLLALAFGDNLQAGLRSLVGLPSSPPIAASTQQNQPTGDAAAPAPAQP